MADETKAAEVDEEQEFSKWLADLQTEDGSEEEVTDEEDALVVAKKTQKVVSEFITEQKVDDMVDRFMADAPQDAKELFAIYRIGDEDPKQLKRIMDLAMTKSAETKKASPEEAEEEETVEAKAEKKAVQIAKENYGVGPISGGSSSTPEEEWDGVSKRIRAGDTHLAFAAWNSLPANGEVSKE